MDNSFEIPKYQYSIQILRANCFQINIYKHNTKNTSQYWQNQWIAAQQQPNINVIHEYETMAN